MAGNDTRLDFRKLYDGFHAPVTGIDCGLRCAPYNPHRKPFCCDICHAVPVAYRPEWDYLREHTRLWHKWRGNECPEEPCNPMELLNQTPYHLFLLACKGPAFCEREYRAVSCRQFPFFPYITSDFRFIGMTYDWDFTGKCWVISHLEQVTSAYRQEFVRTFDQLFSTWLEDLDSYALLSTETRDHYAAINRRFPLLHRNGRNYLVSPKTEKLTSVKANAFKQFSPFID